MAVEAGALEKVWPDTWRKAEAAQASVKALKAFFPGPGHMAPEKEITAWENILCRGAAAGAADIARRATSEIVTIAKEAANACDRATNDHEQSLRAAYDAIWP